MKRIGNLYHKVCSIENLYLADSIAQKGKSKQYGVIAHNKREDENIFNLHKSLINKTFKTSEYKTFKVYERKEREVFSLPYYPDRLVHHALMNVIEPILTNTFTSFTYGCIKGRGVHKGGNAIKKALKDVAGTEYCLKLDIKKFYPSVNNDILKSLLRKKFKDNDLLNLIDGIIDSAQGLPIGNFMSQGLSNFYLSGLDHWLKEVKKVKYVFRYVDDIIILSSDKQYLHNLRLEISDYLNENLRLELKGNWQVFPVAKRGIDFLGYKYYHGYTLLRKRIKQDFARAVAKNKSISTIASYKGWAKHCNSKHLMKKLLPDESV